MVRTTRPRPMDIATVFPELAPLARQAVRLHSWPGMPGVHDSSIGRPPALRPTGEEWPTCTKPHRIAIHRSASMMSGKAARCSTPHGATTGRGGVLTARERTLRLPKVASVRVKRRGAIRG